MIRKLVTTEYRLTCDCCGKCISVLEYEKGGMLPKDHAVHSGDDAVLRAGWHIIDKDLMCRKCFAMQA